MRIQDDITRRDFLRLTASAATAVALVPSVGLARARAKGSATDQVALGKTGLKLSRIGIGTGSNGGKVQRDLGQESFTRVVRHAYERGLTYIDTADAYKTHTMIREAIRGIPREKLFIQTKMGGNPENPSAEIERFRQELGVDYIDSLLVHCTVTPQWDDERRRVLDALEEAKSKGLIRAKGVSCHSLPALSRAAAIDFVDVHLVRINPQGAHMDTSAETWDATSDPSHVAPVVEQLRTMRANGHGIIGMKLIGNGDFTSAEDRERSIRFVMQSGLVDAAVVGVKSVEEVDEAIERVHKALAAVV